MRDAFAKCASLWRMLSRNTKLATKHTRPSDNPMMFTAVVSLNRQNVRSA
jgi:hypothetical protein